MQFSVIGHCTWGDGANEGKDVATIVATLPENEDVTGLDFSPDGKYLATSTPNTTSVHLWDWNGTGKIVRTAEKVDGRDDLVASEPLRFSPNGKFLAGTDTVWNPRSGAVVFGMKASNGVNCVAVAFSPDGKWLFRAFSRSPEILGDNFTVYDTADWHPVWGLGAAWFYPDSMALSPDGKFAALAGPNLDAGPVRHQVRIIDLSKRAIVRTLEMDATRLAWSPDGIHLAVAGGVPSIVIIDAASGATVDSESGESGRAFVRYTRDGKYLIESVNGDVRIWDGQHRTLLQRIKAMPGNIAVSGDGRYFALSEGRKIIVWSLK